MSDTIITLKNVTKIYEGKTILQNVNLSVPEGQSLTLCGHNGSGKSTLLKLMAGLVKPHLRQCDCHKETTVSLHTGAFFQRPI